MGEFTDQMMAGGPGVLDVADCTEQQQEFLRAARQWSTRDLACVVEAILRDAIEILADEGLSEREGFAALDRSTAMSSLCRVAVAIATWGDGPTTETIAREVMVWVGQGPAIFSRSISRAMARAAVLRARIWRSGVAGSVGDIASAIASVAVP